MRRGTADVARPAGRRLLRPRRSNCSSAGSSCCQASSAPSTGASHTSLLVLLQARAAAPSSSSPLLALLLPAAALLLLPPVRVVRASTAAAPSSSAEHSTATSSVMRASTQRCCSSTAAAGWAARLAAAPALATNAVTWVLPAGKRRLTSCGRGMGSDAGEGLELPGMPENTSQAHPQRQDEHALGSAPARASALPPGWPLPQAARPAAPPAAPPRRWRGAVAPARALRCWPPEPRRRRACGRGRPSGRSPARAGSASAWCRGSPRTAARRCWHPACGGGWAWETGGVGGAKPNNGGANREVTARPVAALPRSGGVSTVGRAAREAHRYTLRPESWGPMVGAAATRAGSLLICVG